MDDLDDDERRRIDDLGDRLGDLDLGGLPVLASVLDDLCALLGAEQLSVWGFDATSAGLRLTFSLMVARVEAEPGDRELKFQLCEQPLQAWIVAYQIGPFTPRQEATLAAAAATLGARLAAARALWRR
jgi:hypothetical protein